METTQRKTALAALAVLVSVLLGCGWTPGKPKGPETGIERLNRLGREAARRTTSEGESANEIAMIEYRRRLMGKAGLQLYVVFFNDMGQPIDYFVTDGKCASSRKRLIPGWAFRRGQVGLDSDSNYVEGDFVLPTSGEDGTYGKADEYIHCRTADGKYRQWNGPYYASDAPLELTIKPLVVDTSGKNQQQQ